jgi:TonB family protein
MSHDTVDSSGLDRLSLWLIHRAALQAPPSLSERLEEEWLADLESRSSSVARLRFAAGCLWATRVIAREYQPAMAGATSPSASERPFSSDLRNDFGRFSKRSSTFLIVASLHLALGYVAFTSLSHTHSKGAPDGMEIQPVVKPPVTERLPQPPHPQVETVPEFHFRIPEVLIPADPVAAPDWKLTENTAADSGPGTGAAPSLPPTPVAKRVYGGFGPGFPNTDDYYPSISKQLGEEGATAIQVCVNASGRLVADPTIIASSGIPRLDSAALRLAKAGSGHYRPDTEDGRPLQSCFPFRIRFQVRR